MATLPKAIVRMMAQREHRMHHFLWHQTRNMWLFWNEETREVLRAHGWEPPRPAQQGNGQGGVTIILDNDSGEDFLYMHRQMIAAVNSNLAEIGDPSYPKVEGWAQVPRPGDADFPVPPAWETGDPGFNQYLYEIKSVDYFEQRFLPYEEAFTSHEFLAGITLGQLGALIEFTIHNWMHMRWCAESEIRPDVDIVTPQQIDPRWDDPSYDWLGDTYSSHVNPLFWKIHGWIDNRIADWMQAHDLSGPVPWKGTWVGEMPPHPAPHSLHAMLVASAALAPESAPAPHDHVSEMEQLVKLILRTRKLFHFYDKVELPEIVVTPKAIG